MRRQRECHTYFYLRQSLDTSKQWSSVMVQESECQKCHDRNRDKLPPFASAIADVAVSGTKHFADREGGGRLYEILGAGDALIVAHVDRLGRDMFDILATVNELVGRKVRVMTPNFMGEEVDLSSFYGKFLLMGMAFMADMQRQNISDRTKEKLAWLRKQGLSCHPVAPFCYKLVERGTRVVHGVVKANRYVEVDYEALEQARTMVAWISHGGLDYVEAAALAAQNGWKRPSGLYWTAYSIRCLERQLQRIDEAGGPEELLKTGEAAHREVLRSARAPGKPRWKYAGRLSTEAIRASNRRKNERRSERLRLARLASSAAAATG